MCDFSLEMINSRPAKEGEDLVVRRFPSGSRGFVGKADADKLMTTMTVIADSICAVCCKDGVEMTLHLPEGDRDGVFDQLKTENKFVYRDGFKLADGRRLSMQELPDGTRATVIRALPAELVEAVKTLEAFEPEIRVDVLVPEVADVELLQSRG